MRLGGGQHHRLAGFLDRSIQSRIGIRILIENQVALASQARKTRDERDGYVGVRQLRHHFYFVVGHLSPISQLCSPPHAPHDVLR